ITRHLFRGPRAESNRAQPPVGHTLRAPFQRSCAVPVSCRNLSWNPSQRSSASSDRHRRKRMRIAQIAPLYEAVPPKLYGGTERVVSYLTEALVDLGHAVTLFARGDSVTSANLDACWPRALRLDSTIRDALA